MLRGVLHKINLGVQRVLSFGTKQASQLVRKLFTAALPAAVAARNRSWTYDKTNRAAPG